MDEVSALFDPLRIGGLTLPHRVLMAPLTRNRAHADGTPNALSETYYRQRASAGLIVSEATQVSPMGKGYVDTPGIYTEGHVAAWREITDAVHAAGGRIFCQLWHVGRVSHVSFLPEGRHPVSASDIRAKARTYTAEGFMPVSAPVALDAEGIAETIADFRTAAQCAKDAGFDGIEVHAANGYLIEQFLEDGVNTRTDEYGGSIENRMRLLEQVLDAVSEVWETDRVGVRLSPLVKMNDVSDSDHMRLYSEVYKMLDRRGLAYLHIVERLADQEQDPDLETLVRELRTLYTGVYIANGDYDARSSVEAIESGHADAVAIGRAFIANPDLPERYRRGAPLNTPIPETFFGGDESGFTDYPSLEESA